MFTEVTEVRDAIGQLTARAINQDVARALVREMAWYDAYLQQGGADRSANTTPGNHLGGLANIVEKALGSVAKSGTSAISGVLAPGKRMDRKGLIFAASPASDFISSTQYFATVMFAPLINWITSAFGWPWVFGAMGGVGLTLTAIWFKVIHNPADHPMINKAEPDYIGDGGGLIHMDDAAKAAGGARGAKWDYVRQLFSNRMMVGIFLGQFCINVITYFFITWFPMYLVQARGMSILKVGFIAAIPAICGFSGGILGGVVSDWLIRRGWSLTAARKTPIVLGMSLALTLIAANYTNLQWMVVMLMALAFFGKGFGALGWAVMSDAAPKEITGLAGAVFNMRGNLSSISTPLIIGGIVRTTRSFNGALIFVGGNAVVAALSYLIIVGDIKRMELRPQAALAESTGRLQ